MRHLRTAAAVGIAAILSTSIVNCSQVGFDEAPIELPSFCVDISKPEVRPTLLWDWKTELAASPGPRYETFDQVMASPMVADLDGDGLSEVVFSSFSVTAADKYADSPTTTYTANGVLRIVNGQTGRTILSYAGPDVSPYASQAPLLMDIDNDGKIEIFYVAYKRDRVVALNYDGTPRWVMMLPVTIGMATTGITGARLDNTGASEISVGPYILSEDSNKLPFIQATMNNSVATHYTTLAMPLDPSNPSRWSVITHSGIYQPNGTMISGFPANVRYVAAADIAPEIPGIEVVATGPAALMIFNGLTGATIQSIDLTQFNDLKCPSNSIGGGPPSVGDFDGDPATLEIAVATGRHLTIFDRNGQPKYKTVTQDCSSLVTGLTSFDMNGDGKPEVLYADEEYLRIFEIRNGKLEIMHSIVNPSGTLYEYPVVADLMGTGRSSNIILASNNYAVAGFYSDADQVKDRPEAQGITGVRAFRSTGDLAWAPTKNIWNQHSFHPDLVNSRGQFQYSPVLDKDLFRRNTQGVLEKTYKPCKH